MSLTPDQGWLGFAKTGGVVLAVLVALTQLWNWTTPLFQGDELVADVSFGPFVQVPRLRSEIESFGELLNLKGLESLVNFDRLVKRSDDARATEILLHDVLREVSRSLRDRLITSLSYSDLLWPGGMYRVLVTNKGRRSLSEVTITLPDTQFLSLKREGENPSQCESGEVIELGTLRPQELVLLVSWASREPSRRSAGRIKLTHSEGVGDVVVRAPVGALGQWIEKYWIGALILLTGALGIILLVVCQLIESATENKE